MAEIEIMRAVDCGPVSAEQAAAIERTSRELELVGWTTPAPAGYFLNGKPMLTPEAGTSGRFSIWFNSSRGYLLIDNTRNVCVASPHVVTPKRAAELLSRYGAKATNADLRRGDVVYVPASES